jgi:hypothetical protein
MDGPAAALLAGWSVLWFVNVVYLGANHAATVVRGDDGPRDILVWVLGLVAIIAIRVWLYRKRSR